MSNSSWWPILSLIGLIILSVTIAFIYFVCSADDDDDISSEEDFPNYDSVSKL
jgi:uncharacterized membrane protein